MQTPTPTWLANAQNNGLNARLVADAVTFSGTLTGIMAQMIASGVTAQDTSKNAWIKDRNNASTGFVYQNITVVPCDIHGNGFDCGICFGSFTVMTGACAEHTKHHRGRAHIVRRPF